MLVVSQAAGFIDHRPKRMPLEVAFSFWTKFRSFLLGHKLWL
jgi:hypothetical protein